jgi:membrane protease YdiL (CAAX protease family)
MLAPGLLSERQLPHWAVVYSLSIFWLVWSPTEEVIYQAYCAARLQALTGSTYATVTLVGFWWAFQHSVFPLLFDWRLIVFRFLQFLPLVVVFQLVYLRTRRLPRMIVMHWPMDLFAALLTLKL